MSKLKMSFLIVFVIVAFFSFSQSSKTVIDDWNAVKIPPPPELMTVTIDPKTTAFLILDVQINSCTSDKRPRCVETVPKIKAFLTLARAKKMLVVHSLTSSAKPEDIIKDVAPLPTEAIVKSSVDKFYGTDLEKILKDKGITTVIVVGTAAHGAVLYTATGASLRKLKVIVPVDGMSAEDIYIEQYTAYHLVNSPGTRQNVVLTKFDLMKF